MDVLGLLSSPASGDSAENSPAFEKCSRKGCLSAATWQVQWNNPKIHEASRRKIWLACNNHREYLENFLKARNFWKETVALT
ncbi:MAG: acetone carboxylase [Rothia sp. (in: high G+C Gram-positive bacteria)]|nr:acetone carboxylase [Rothia sp. (in: high G+C Gram-positive bacteria)]